MKTITTVFVFLLVFTTCFSQSPPAFQYQAILRTDDGNPVINTAVSLKISILSDTIQNAIFYAESQNTVTDNFGRISLQVGKGTVLTGDFSDILWESGQIFIKVEFDPVGGSNFQLLGKSQLLSVPYALYANQSGNVLVAGPGINITGNTISNIGDLSAGNELQILSKIGNNISLNPGGGGVTDSDNQTLVSTVNGTSRQVQISGGNSISLDVADNDNNPSNELQVISISHDTLFLSNGGFAKLPASTNAVVPVGGCIQSTNPTPPTGYTYSGTGFTAGDQWNTLAPMGNSRFGSAVAAVGNQIFVMGGWDGTAAVSKVVEMYDLQTKTWTRKTNMTTGTVFAASAVVGTLIHVMGGYNGSSAVSTHLVYNTLTDSWAQSTALTSPRSGCSAAVVSQKIYLIGGFYNEASLNTNEMFDPATNTWTTKTAMTTARTDFAIASLNDLIYAIGGWGTDVLNTNEVYSPATNTWTTYYPMNTYRSACSGVVAGNKIYVLGGGDSYRYTSQTEVYNPATNEWISTSNIPTPRSYFGAVGIGAKIYVVGGNSGASLNSLLEYDPTTVQYYIHCAE
jgi:N-acetylneuraminic acid mutarotase